MHLYSNCHWTIANRFQDCHSDCKQWLPLGRGSLGPDFLYLDFRKLHRKPQNIGCHPQGLPEVVTFPPKWPEMFQAIDGLKCFKVLIWREVQRAFWLIWRYTFITNKAVISNASIHPSITYITVCNHSQLRKLHSFWDSCLQIHVFTSDNNGYNLDYIYSHSLMTSIYYRRANITLWCVVTPFPHCLRVILCPLASPTII